VPHRRHCVKSGKPLFAYETGGTSNVTLTQGGRCATVTPTVTVGEKIRQERLRVGLSMRALGRLIDQDHPEQGRRNLYRWEDGTHTPSEKWRDAIADALEIPRETFSDNGAP
jgi:hypothetical protein